MKVINYTLSPNYYPGVSVRLAQIQPDPLDGVQFRGAGGRRSNLTFDGMAKSLLVCQPAPSITMGDDRWYFLDEPLAFLEKGFIQST